MTQQEIKQLIEKYPYLMPRNVWTDEVAENYNYDHIIYTEIPHGWNKLFLQLCEDIRQPLIDADYLDKFRFTQVKEKFNTLRCYNNGAPQEVHDILSKYEVMAGYVCTKCGKPAVYETHRYIASFCEDCYKNLKGQPKADIIDFKPYFKVTQFSKDERITKTISFEEEWNRYLFNRANR